MKLWLATSVILATTAPVFGQEDLRFSATGQYQVVLGEISGYDTADYRITALQSQIISVDLQSSGTSAYFNITPEGEDSAIFIGSTQGNVADLPAPADAAYILRVYQMRASARRNETADFALGVSIGAPEFADGVFGGPDYWAVTGISVQSMLNMRQGPDTRYDIVGQLERGSVLQNRGCRLTGEMRWCDVREVGTGLAGWVAGQYLSETAPPTAPQTDPDGPIGIGIPFDATGRISCNVPAGAGETTCPFGVIRQGPGNAGVWVTLPGRAEQQFLFEGGVLVASSPAAEFTVTKDADTFMITISGNSFAIPEAVIFGG